MKTTQSTIKATVTTEQEFKVTKQQEQDFQIALDYAKNYPGKFAHSFIGKGRWIAVTTNGETVTKILTTTMAQFPPCDIAVMNGEIVTKAFFESQKEKRII
jgi:hypothetical protein